MKRYVIIGNGVAGATACENIRKNDPDGSITMITEEDIPFYYRVRLPEFISGDITEQELIAKKEEWYRKNNIDLILNQRVVKGDKSERIIETDKGKRLEYDFLLIATGSRAFIPPIKGVNKAGVFTLRNIRDARDIVNYADSVESVVLIGGGLLGLETGNALRKLGKDLMVVEFFPRLLPRQLDSLGAKKLQEIMEGMGFSFRLGARTQEIKGEEKVEGVILEGGEVLDADMVIISAGVRPDIELAKTMGLRIDKGIVVDDHLRTDVDTVYAAGDVAEFNGMLYGIWPAAMEQGKIAGVNMAGGDMKYTGTPMANTLKVLGVNLASAGDIDPDGLLESRTIEKQDVYKKIVIKDNKIVGCIMLGDTEGFNRIKKAMADKRDISDIKDRILEEGFDFNLLN